MKERTSIVLAGGESKRMGQSKALLEVDGKLLIKTIVQCAEVFAPHVIVVATQQDEHVLKEHFINDEHVVIVTDDQVVAQQGPLAGMYTGMNTIPAQQHLILACDFPYMNEEYISGLSAYVNENPGYAAYLPKFEKQIQPFAGVYKDMRAKIHTLLIYNKHKWWDLHASLQNICLIEEQQWQSWTTNSKTLWNMNSKDDYERFMEETP